MGLPAGRQARVLARFSDYICTVIDALLVSGLTFFRNFVGIVVHPYEAMRRIAERGKIGELLFVGLLLALYFAISSLVRVSAFRPFLLTRQFMVLFNATLVGYILSVLALWFGGKLVGSSGTLSRLAIAWGYTLVPTVFWFLATSLLYVVLPPPRTTSPQGIALSVLFLLFSSVLLFWKGMLSYLAIRFSLRLALPKILVVLCVALPAWTAYTVAMYRLGVFRVPFL